MSDMSRKFAYALAFITLLGMINITSKVQPVKANGTIYIKPDGTVFPSTPLIQQNGDIYTLLGNISSDINGIVIQRSNITLNGNGYVVQGQGNGAGISLEGTSNVTIKNIMIKEFRDGICLSEALSNSIFGVNVTESKHFGVSLYLSSKNSIEGINVIDGNGYGVYLGYSSDNSIVGNNITNYEEGIWLQSSLNNNVTENQIAANETYGIRVDESSNNNTISRNTLTKMGLFVTASYGNIIEDNTINGKPLAYLESISNYTIGNAGQVVLVNCDNIRVENLNLSNTTVGLELYRTNNCKIANNSIAINWCGIVLTESSNNAIIQNNITGSKWYGIQLDRSSNNSLVKNHIANHYTGVSFDSSSNNSIIGNNVTENNHWGIIFFSSSNNSICENSLTKNKDDDGISLYAYSNYNNISGNYIAANYLNGISLLTSANNSIVDNNITENIQNGIGLYSSSNNNITGNNITANNNRGIWIQDSSNNTIFHNNFVDNIIQVYTFNSVNVWDYGYPLGGNYWSDYNGTDIYSGSFQNETGSDKIGDKPYAIDADNRDHYPIIPEFQEHIIARLFMIATLSVVIAYKKKALPAKKKMMMK